MTKVNMNLLELTDLENIKLKTINHEGKRYYLGEDDMADQFGDDYEPLDDDFNDALDEA